MNDKIWTNLRQGKEVLQGVGKPYVMSAALRDTTRQCVLINAAVMEDFYTKWRVERRANLATLVLTNWMVSSIRNFDLDMQKPEDRDHLLLSAKPSQRATRYFQITAFKNHFRVDKAISVGLQSNNNDMVLVFEQPSENAGDLSVNYVGVLKDILLLDYGDLSV